MLAGTNSGRNRKKDLRRLSLDPTDLTWMYTIFPINPPPSPAQLAAYKELRLTSLRIDKQAFSSTYERELAFSEDVWLERLDTPFKRTFVASVQNNALCKDEVEEVDEWIGTACIVGPSVLLPSVLEPFRAAGVGNNWETYVLYAMWVHPTHRGKGVGVRLVEACLDWARKNEDPKFPSKNETHFEKTVVLLVHDDNVAGRALYLKAGFRDVEEVTESSGETWMATKV